MTVRDAEASDGTRRCCGTCQHAREDLAGMHCMLIDEQRASTGRGPVDAGDFCDQHDYRVAHV